MRSPTISSTSCRRFRSDFPKLNWFLDRVLIIWLFLTLVIISAVLHSIYQSGGFH